ncbi:MAG: hypothetical protein NTZ05_22425 [Chloroflexi bacterium]|nr:hypothetical protein [Chloroflexota bacterium]
MQAFLAALAAAPRAGLRPPASWLGAAGLFLTAMVMFLPALGAFAGAWPLLLLITLAGWLGMAMTQTSPRDPRPLLGGDPYVLRALERRDALEAELANLTVAGLGGDVRAMLRIIDRETLPDLDNRARRYRALTGRLQQYQQGQGALVGASPERIALLRGQAEQQKKALDGLITMLSDMNANLLGLNQEDDHTELTRQAQAWASDLGSYWQATAEVFQHDDAPTDDGGKRGGR